MSVTETTAPGQARVEEDEVGAPGGTSIDVVRPPEGPPTGGVPPVPGTEDEDFSPPTGRGVLACLLSCLGAAVMVGGIFQGAGGRVYACVFAAAGVGLGAWAARMRRADSTLALVAVGLFAAGLVAVLPSGYSNLVHLRQAVSLASKEGSLLRPPVAFLPGWHAVVGWLLAITGLVSVWIALVLERPAIGLLAPLPLAAIAGISVPKDAQVASGIVVVVLFCAGLGLLYAPAGQGRDGRPSLGFELRRALRSLVLLALISGALVGLSRTHFLFPAPSINPTEQAQLPKTEPLTTAANRVLFEVKSKVTGPWRSGSLDVYDGTDWRLPPYAQTKIRAIPSSGVVDTSLPTGETATFTVEGLSGAILPTLPNTVGVVAKGPQLAYDYRSGIIRLIQGQVTKGFVYTVAAAPLPKVTDLEKDDRPLPTDIKQFLSIPSEPAAIRSLIAQLHGANKWDTFNNVREWILDHVTVAGQGVPTAVPPSKIANMISDTHQGTPYEIVAAQAMVARWVGIPSRIGYGFDGGREVNGVRQITPADAATFVEVYYPGYEWLPVIGTPLHAKPSSSKPGLQQSSTAQASNTFGANFFLPLVTSPASRLPQEIALIAGLVVAAVLLVLLIWFLLPGVRKAIARGRRRRSAAAGGPTARVALAYAEWRDLSTDYGYDHPSDTPLAYLDRVAPDEEHSELAWLVTRVLWGDLRGEADDNTAVVAEELSRALRRRMNGAQPLSARMLAILSRRSERSPWAPDLLRQLAEATTNA